MLTNENKLINSICLGEMSRVVKSVTDKNHFATDHFAKMLLDNFVVTNKLVIHCEVHVIGDAHNHFGTIERFDIQSNYQQMVNDFNDLYESQRDSDVSLIVRRT